MARSRKKIVESDFGFDEEPKPRPALSPEARENELIALAYDLVEKRLREGTATSQETTHFLKMGSMREKREDQLLRKQLELLDAKIENLNGQKDMNELYKEAISAFKSYRSDAGLDDDENCD